MRALDQDLEIVAPDLPCHGRSSAPQVDCIAGYFTDAIEQFLDRLDLRRVLLVGESIGASIARALGARENPRLSRQWKTWIAARAIYSAAELPITLVYGDHDWSRPEDREANGRVQRIARTLAVENCGHFACLDQPQQIARVIRDEIARMWRE